MRSEGKISKEVVSKLLICDAQTIDRILKEISKLDPSKKKDAKKIEHFKRRFDAIVLATNKFLGRCASRGWITSDAMAELKKGFEEIQR